jgi:hypothetical protein
MTALLAAVFLSLFAAAGARAQPATEAVTAASAAGATPPQAASPAPAPAPQIAPPAPAPQAALPPPAAAPPASPAPPPPPPAWERQSSAPQPAPAAKPRPEYDGPPLAFGRRPAVGGYAGFSVAYTKMLDRDGALLGFEGALLVAHRLSLGLAGYGFSRSPEGPADWDGTAREFGTGYGGFVGRYAFLTHSPVYLSVGILLGGGAAVLHESVDFDDSEDWDEDDHEDGQADGFFVVQPELSLHVNLTRWMRLGLTGGYRATSGVSRFGLSERDLNGVVLGGNVQFGWI